MSRALYSLAQLVAYFLRLGAIGFGGPVALTGYTAPEPVLVLVAALIGLGIGLA